VFTEVGHNFDIVSVDLATAAVTPMMATQRWEEMPAWASREAALVYVTDRNGVREIWLHKPGQPDRPLVTARDFPEDTTMFLMAPSLSPDATRVVYTRAGSDGKPQLWMSAVAGGSPVQLVKGGTGATFGGSWSPDGNWYVYWNRGVPASLNKVKTTGQGLPEVLKADLKARGTWLPVWSPSGEWILHEDGGLKLTSPDGRTTRDLSSASALSAGS
jgi:Tol biopolymer transport system component